MGMHSVRSEMTSKVVYSVPYVSKIIHTESIALFVGIWLSNHVQKTCSEEHTD